MINQLAERVVQFQLNAEMLREDERQLYEYAYQIIISRGLSLAILLMIGYLTHATGEILLFSIIFMALRQYAGGIHLQHQGACIMFSAVLIGGIGIFISSAARPEWNLFWLPVEVVSAAVIYGLAPVDCAGKRLDPQEQTVYRQRTGIVLAVQLLIAAFLLSLGQVKYVQIIVIAHAVVGASMVLHSSVTKNKLIKSEETGA